MREDSKDSQTGPEWVWTTQIVKHLSEFHKIQFWPAGKPPASYYTHGSFPRNSSISLTLEPDGALVTCWIWKCFSLSCSWRHSSYWQHAMSIGCGQCPHSPATWWMLGPNGLRPLARGACCGSDHSVSHRHLSKAPSQLPPTVLIEENCMLCRVAGWMDNCIDDWIDDRMDAWTDVWMDAWWYCFAASLLQYKHYLLHTAFTA